MKKALKTAAMALLAGVATPPPIAFAQAANTVAAPSTTSELKKLINSFAFEQSDGSSYQGNTVEQGLMLQDALQDEASKNPTLALARLRYLKETGVHFVTYDPNDQTGRNNIFSHSNIYVVGAGAGAGAWKEAHIPQNVIGKEPLLSQMVTKVSDVLKEEFPFECTKNGQPFKVSDFPGTPNEKLETMSRLRIFCTQLQQATVRGLALIPG